MYLFLEKNIWNLVEDILTFHFWPSVWFDFKKYIKYLLYQKGLLKEFEVESSREILDSIWKEWDLSIFVFMQGFP